MTQAYPPKNIIFYADDDVEDLQLVEESFFNYSDNVEVVTAKDGYEALTYLTGLPESAPTPCLVILDVNMPRMNGKEVLVQLRAQERYMEIPIILFTTSSQQVDKDFAAQFKAGFLTKPIEVRQMEVIVDKFIENCTDEVKKNFRKAVR